MRMIVNRLAAFGLKTGIGHYTNQLLEHLWELAGDDVIDPYPRGLLGLARSLTLSLRGYLHRQRNDGAATTPSVNTSAAVSRRRQLLQLMRQCTRAMSIGTFRAVCSWNRYQLYHEPNFIPIPSDLPTVVTVHDLSVLLHPEWHPADRVTWFEKHFQEGIRRCQHFLAISENGRQEIIRHLNIAPERVTRTYMGVRPGLAPLPQEQVQASLKRLGLPPQYLLYLGTLEPRKNVLMLMHAYCSLPDSLRARWPLLLVGTWGWKTGAIAEYLDVEARHRGVLHLGYVPEDQMAVLYNGARALVFPSFYEGFGMPPMEMMACGGAVIASTAGSLVETVGPKAHIVDPLDVDGWRAAMIRVLTEDDWWLSLRQGVIEFARPYTWEQCARDTLRVYREVSGEQPTPVLPRSVVPLEPARRAG